MTALNVDHMVSFPTRALDKMLPMHCVIGSSGHIQSVGSTLNKLRPEVALIGSRFLEVFELRRPRNVHQISDLNGSAGRRLNLRWREGPDIPLKGIAVPLPYQNALLVNLSFGIAAAEAVIEYGLNSSDFAHTDLTIELLYLVEAKEAVMAESHRLNLRLQGAKIAAEEQAFTDTLTGLKNRRAMDVIMQRYSSNSDTFSLMHVDLDHFKEVNDTLGHAAGDFVLQEAAKILTEETRSEDTIVRFGGDEFVLLLHHLTRRDLLEGVATRILNRLQQPMMYNSDVCQISGSIGITVSDDYAEIDPNQMLIDADMALYASKNAGRAQHTFVSDIGGVGHSAEAAEAAAPKGRG